MKDLEQLVRYLDGDLSESERNELIEKLKKDPSLLEKLELIKDVDQLLGDRHLENFEDNVKEAAVQYSQRKETKEVSFRNIALQPFHKMKWMAAAIFIIFFSAAAYLVFHKTIPPSGQKIFAKYYEKLPADFGTRSLETGSSDFNKALDLYNNNKYQDAITAFRKIAQKHSRDQAAQLFLGLCYLETGQENKAANEFRKVINSRDAAFEEHAIWYLSLYYIRTGQNSLAKPLLQNLITAHPFYKEKASGLLKEID